MSRTLNVVRMQLVNRQTFIWIPLIILGGAFLVTLLIWAMLPPGATKYSGGSQGPLWYFVAVGVMAFAYTFPFSQAMSVTRREYFLGTLLTAALTSGILAAIFVVGGLIELATDGWGINGLFFYLPWVWDQGAAVAGLSYFVLAMLLFILGMWCAILYKRFGTVVLVTLLVGIGVLLVGAMWLVGRLDAWGAVGEWIGVNGVLGITLCGVGVAAVLTVISYLTLRRTTP
ncbi:hypothetical protein [Microbacterium sp. Root180]|uniref:hypothetical protein n=1 Tax=Microbacterium sp. Root180 TaxID=1736483 RepID=UPI0007010A0D|nr:hypothetical protein [Microbacterium sp. Root180]KRB37049.1 hypothetical protein ASD93_13675 [Microbacterium sp. Root180]